MNQRAEFHFHSDDHERRLAFLDVLRPCSFKISTFSLDKTSPHLAAPGYQFEESLYKNVCKFAMENAAALLHESKVVIDGSGERVFRRQLQDYLRRNVLIEGRRCVREVVIKRSHSDPLLQVADYCTGVANRLQLGKPGADEYFPRLKAKVFSARTWP